MVNDQDFITLIGRVKTLEKQIERTKAIETPLPGGGTGIPAPTAQYQIVTSNGVPAWTRSSYYLTGYTGHTYAFPDATGTVALLQVANTYTLGPQTVNTGADANIGIIIKANSATQSGHLQEWQDNTGGNMLWVDEKGGIHLPDNTHWVSSGVIYKEEARFLHNFYYGFGSVDGYNTFLGVDSGNFTMGAGATHMYEASYNTGLGYATLTHTTLGYYNTAVGYNALHANTTGNTNIAIGMNALLRNTTGVQNVAIGNASLAWMTTGTYNVCVGSGSGGALAWSGANVALGDNAIRANIPGSGNTSIGHQTLWSAPSGDYNSVLGCYGLLNLVPVGGYIASYSDYGGTVPGTVRAFNPGAFTSLPAGATAGIEIQGSPSYLGVYTFTKIDDNSAYFTHVWAGNDGYGYWKYQYQGNENVAVGVEAGYELVNGYRNTFLGAYAGSHASQKTDAFNSIAIGYGTYNDLDNQAVYGNQDLTEHNFNGSPGRAKLWTLADVDDSGYTVIAHGTYDVTQGISIQYVIRAHAGETMGGILFLEPGDSYNIYDDGSETVELACAADGTVTVTRTAGADVYDVVFWCIWI